MTEKAFASVIPVKKNAQAHSSRASGLPGNKFHLRELRIPPGGLHLIGNLYSLTLNCNTVFPIRKQSGQVCFIYGMSEHTQYAEHIVLPSQPERKDLDGLLRVSGLPGNIFPLRELRIPPGGLSLIGNLYTLALLSNTVFPIRE